MVVSTGAHDRTVGFRVQTEESARAIGITEHVACLAELVEAAQAGVDATGRAARRGRLQQRTYLEQLLHMPDRDRSNSIALAEGDFDESFLAQPLQRGTYRRAANVVLLGQLRLRDCKTRGSSSQRMTASLIAA